MEVPLPLIFYGGVSLAPRSNPESGGATVRSINDVSFFRCGPLRPLFWAVGAYGPAPNVFLCTSRQRLLVVRPWVFLRSVLPPFLIFIICLRGETAEWRETTFAFHCSKAAGTRTDRRRCSTVHVTCLRNTVCSPLKQFIIECLSGLNNLWCSVLLER